MLKQEIIKKTAEELLEKLEVEADVEIKTPEDETPQVNITTQEAGILIGFHGETLRAFELVLTFLISKKVGEFTRVSVDVGGYKKQKEEKLLEFARNIKDQVINAGKEVPMPNLTPQERRIVHLYFQNDSQVTTESQGEGDARLLVIKPK